MSSGIQQKYIDYRLGLCHIGLMRDEILEEVFERRTAYKLALDLGLTSQAVYQWRRVPAERALEVERLTGISRHKLRPDVFGPAA